MAVPSSDEERDLVRRISARDERASVLFQEQYYGTLFTAARNNGLTREDSQDAVQEVLVAATQHIQAGRFRGDSSVETWLHGILRHKVLDHWRTYFRRGARTVAIQSLVSTSPTAPAQAACPVGTDEMDTVIQVREVLANLPNDLRSILLLNETEGWTIAEIASMLRMRPGTVGRKLAGAKETFRRLISERASTLTAQPQMPNEPPAKRLPRRSDNNV